jgi:cytochrome c-type biogenesis protein CcmH/NrfG
MGKHLRKRRAELEKRVKQNRGDPEAWFELGLFEFKHGEHSSAEECFKRSLKVSGNRHVESMASLAVIRLDEGRYKDAEQLLRKTLSLEPDHPDVMGLLSTAVCHLKKYDESVALAKKATEIDPENAAAWNQLAIVLEITGDLASGEKAARCSLGIDPKNSDHWITLGANLEKQERFDEAEDAYKTSVRIEPHFALGHKCLEQLYLKMGRFEDAQLAWFPDLGEFAKSLTPEERARLMDYVKIGEDALKEYAEKMLLRTHR